MTPMLPYGIAIVATTLFALQKRAEFLAQPARLKMAEIGEVLLARPDASAAMKRQVEFMLDGAFGMHLTIGASYVAALGLVPLALFKPSWVKAHIAEMECGASAETREMFARLNGLHDRVSFANHPIMMALLWAELIALILVFGPFALILSQKDLPFFVNPENVLSTVGTREGKRLAFA